MGGQIRRPSLMQAWRYGRSLASASVIGNEIRLWDSAASISEMSLAYTRGLLMIWSSVARTAVAVVSEPATLCVVSVSIF